MAAAGSRSGLGRGGIEPRLRGVAEGLAGILVGVLVEIDEAVDQVRSGLLRSDVREIARSQTVRAALARAEDVDVRGNPGGLVDEEVERPADDVVGRADGIRSPSAARW